MLSGSHHISSHDSHLMILISSSIISKVISPSLVCLCWGVLVLDSIILPNPQRHRKRFSIIIANFFGQYSRQSVWVAGFGDQDIKGIGGQAAVDQRKIIFFLHMHTRCYTRHIGSFFDEVVADQPGTAVVHNVGAIRLKLIMKNQWVLLQRIPAYTQAAEDTADNRCYDRYPGIAPIRRAFVGNG